MVIAYFTTYFLRARPAINGLPDKDPSFKITEPRIQIHRKYLRIHITGKSAIYVKSKLGCDKNLGHRNRL
jgi:hypothetical protein